MIESYIAKAEIDIEGAPTAVWKALTDPELVAKYFFGTQVQTDWQPGSPIVWKGEYEGKKYEDKGEILDVQPNRLLRVTHFSPMTGLADKPENYHTLTYALDERGGSTHVTLSQDNNGSEEEAERSTANWETVLAGLKKTVENA
jgi:uncharacterized protein YndB with AHSA1/START domain